MARHARQLAESGIYHVMLRGVNGDTLFLEDGDRERFLTVLGLVKEISGCRFFAYCLMTNHVHLVLRATDEPVDVVMKRIGVRYAGWFNHKYGRFGHLFQDRFASVPVDTDEYLVSLLRYVWNNPVKARLVERPEEYPWSSRRLLGRASVLLDERELCALVPGSLDDLASGPSDASVQMPRDVEKPPRHTHHEAAELLRLTCGAGNPEEFLGLGRSAQRTVVAQLRTRSLSYAQIATVTGLSTSGVRRLHLSAPPAPVDI